MHIKMSHGEAGSSHVQDDSNLLVQHQLGRVCFPWVCSCQIHILHLLLELQMRSFL